MDTKNPVPFIYNSNTDEINKTVLVAASDSVDINKDKVICSCNNVTYQDIVEAINNGASSVEDVIKETSATTSCGMCENEVVSIVNSLLKSKE